MDQNRDNGAYAPVRIQVACSTVKAGRPDSDNLHSQAHSDVVVVSRTDNQIFAVNADYASVSINFCRRECFEIESLIM